MNLQKKMRKKVTEVITILDKFLIYTDSILIGNKKKDKGRTKGGRGRLNKSSEDGTDEGIG